MTTETQTAGTNTNDTGTAAPPDSLLTTPPAEGAAPAAEGTAPAAEGAAPAGAPEEYADFVVPEGLALNQEVLGDLKTLAKEKNLGQEDTQKFVDLGAKIVQKVEAGYQEQIATVQMGWLEATKTDKEFGGDKLQENVAVAKQALDAFGSPELSALLAESGLGNHPEIIRAFYRVGLKMSPDQLITGTTKPQGAGASPAETFYPSMKK